MAASTFYLEHYLDSLEDLPVDLKNNFSRMHDLDKRYQYLPGIVSPTTVP
jgi:inhibitor of growth protein 4